MKKLVFTLSMLVLVCSCQPSKPMQNGNGQYNDQNRQGPPPPQRRPGGGCCETEKPQQPAAAPQQAQATVATPEVKVEKTQ